MADTAVRQIHFLIVDDHAVVRSMVQQHLKSCGYTRFTFANDGSEAKHHLKVLLSHSSGSLPVEMLIARLELGSDLYPQEGTPRPAATEDVEHAHCVITDFGMPHINGLQLLKAIRCGETNVRRDTPVILLTGYAEDYVVAAALQLDVNAFIVKPVSRNALAERVERVMSTEFELKSISEYGAISVPDEAGGIIGAPAKIKRAAVAPVHRMDVDWLMLQSVEIGAVLAGDLFSQHGTLLLRNGTVFSEGILHKLKDVERMKGFKGQIPIKKPPAKDDVVVAPA